MAWDLLIDRSDLSHTELVDVPTPTPGPGQVVLRSDRVGMTANNVTYAVFGEAMKYWDFFPTDDPAFGRVPLWGFAEVETSTVSEVAEGTRLYGYLPTSSHLVVQPSKADAKGFRDASPHRQHLPTPYNGLITTAEDPAYHADQEDLQVLYRPLFMTSFVLADFITDHDCFGARTVVISSASEQDLLRRRLPARRDPPRRAHQRRQPRVHRVPRLLRRGAHVRRGRGAHRGPSGLRRRGRRSRPPAQGSRAAGPGALGGSRRRPPRRRARSRRQRRPTRQQPDLLLRPRPDAQALRRLGPGRRRAPPRRGLGPLRAIVAGWVDVTLGAGPTGLDAAWKEVLAGATPPRVGHVIVLGD